VGDQVSALGAVDLVLIGQKVDSDESFSIASEIRRSLPELLIIMLVDSLELPLVVNGLRHGVSDIWPGGTDSDLMKRRVRAQLNLTVGDEPTDGELAQAEMILARLDPTDVKSKNSEEILALQARLDRTLRELQAEREWVVAAKVVVEEKDRLLGKRRDTVQRETREFQGERRQWEQTLDELEEKEEAMRVHEENLRVREQKMATAVELGGQTLPGTAIDLGQAWESYTRAAKTLAADKATFRDERMALTDLEKQLKEGKARLRELDEQLESRETKRRGLVLPPPKGFVKPVSQSRPPMKQGFFRSMLGGAR
jgi:hypothetical protein